MPATTVSWRSGDRFQATVADSRKPGAAMTAGSVGAVTALGGRRAAVLSAWCAALILLPCGSGQGQAAGPEADAPASLNLTLVEAVHMALRNNRRLFGARLERVVERFSLRVAENRFRPHVTVGPYVESARTAPSGDTGTAGLTSELTLRIPTGGAFAVRLDGGASTGDVAADSRWSSALELAFTQPLLRGAGREIDTAPVRIARIEERIAVLALGQAVTDVVSETIGRYRDYMRAEHRVAIRAGSLERARELLAVNELLVETGRMAERDIVQTKADIAGRELRLIAARNDLDAARLALADILDVDSGTAIKLADTLTDTEHPVPALTDVDRGVETALVHRPDYLRAVLGIRNAETRVAVAEDALRWDLSATLSTRFARSGEAIGSGGPGEPDYGIRMDLAIPLGDTAVDPERHEHVAAAVALRKARNDLADLRQRIDIEVRNAVREVELLHRQVALARTARDLVDEKTEIEKEKLRLGLSSNFHLVAFEDDLVAAENSELDARIAYLNSLTSLDRTLGVTLERWNIELEVLDRDPVR